MRKFGMLSASALALFAGGCAQLGVKSLPWPTSTAIYNSEAMNFLRDAPSAGDTLGEGLKVRDMAADDRLVGLSISGGGARAAAFTLGVLAELQALPTADGKNALEHVDFMSSNSGGSWAVAAYLAERTAHPGPGYRLQDNMPGIVGRFVAQSAGRVPCWSQAMLGGIPGRVTFRQVYAADNPAPLPAAYFNASLLPAHAPFVFTDANLQYYHVAQFGACAGDLIPTTDPTHIADLPIGYAAATSGTVPGFYYAYARTTLCADGVPVSAASFCRNRRKDAARYLRLADGGLYDNIGYKTAYEVMLAQGKLPVASRAMLLINSATPGDDKTIPFAQRDSSFLFTTASNSVFAVQDATFEHLYKPMFRSLGVHDPVLLDFYSTANFRPDQVALLTGLDRLAFIAAHDVRCFGHDGLTPQHREKLRGALPKAADSFEMLVGKGGDCAADNFYRTGNVAKTTYLAEEKMFTTLWQLGQLSVRMNCERILAAVDGPAQAATCRRRRY